MVERETRREWELMRARRVLVLQTMEDVKIKTGFGGLCESTRCRPCPARRSTTETLTCSAFRCVPCFLSLQ